MIEKFKIKNDKGDRENRCQNQFIALLREEFHYNIGVILLGLLAMFFNYPLNLAMRLSNEIEKFNRTGIEYKSYIYGTSQISMAEDKLKYVMENITNGILRGDIESFMMIIMVVLAIICARSMFKHLFSKQSVDFYLSQPVSRIKRYLVNYIGGLIIGIVCITVGYLMALIVAAGYHVENIDIYESIKISLGYFVMYALTYTVSVIAMILTGNAFAAAGAVLCFFFFFPIADALISGLKAYYFSFYVSEDIGLMYLSPIFVMANYFDAVSSLKLMPFALVRNTVFAVIVLAVTGGLLYRIRPAEACGKAVAFSVLKRPIRMLLSITAGAGAMTWIGMVYNDNIVWIVIFVVLGTVISHSILEVIINADVRTILNDKIEKLVCILAAFSVIMFFKYDAFGYDSYLPSNNEIEAVSIDVPYNAFEERWEMKSAEYEYEHLEDKYSETFWRNYPDIIDDGLVYSDQAIDVVLDIGRAAIEEKKEGLNEDREDTVFTRVCFHLKNGDKVNRRYILSKQTMDKVMPELFDDEEFKTVMYPILTEETGDMGGFGIELASAAANDKAEAYIMEKSGEADVVLPVYPEIAAKQVIGLSFDKKLEEELLEALKKDIRAMRYLDYKDWWDKNGYPTVDLLYYITDEAVKLYEYYGSEDEIMIEYSDAYPIFESFVNVRNVLKNYGIELSK